MARVSRVSRSGPGFGGLIVFIVFCLLLIAGYVPLWMQFVKRTRAIEDIQSYVKQNLEDRLVPQGLEARGRQTVSPADLRYDAGFFAKVADAAEKGLKYDELAQKAGYTEENPIPQMEEDLNELKVTELTVLPLAPESLQKKIEILQAMVAKDEQIIARLTTQVKEAQGERANLDSLLEQAQRTYDQGRKKLEGSLLTAQRQYADGIAIREENVRDALDAKDEALKNYYAALDDSKKLSEELSKNIDLLEREKADLLAELQRKKPKPIAVTEGRVLEADLTQDVVIIDLGKREGIANGEKFAVMGIEKGGERLKKGEIQIVRVDDNISTAHIMKGDLENPITVRDVVWRQKQFEEEK